MNKTLVDPAMVDTIRTLRNDLIKDFLDERHLKDYLAVNFNIREISAIKIEFIRRDLKELLIAPVDLLHYKSVVDDITNDASSPENKLFYHELNAIFKNYIY